MKHTRYCASKETFSLVVILIHFLGSICVLELLRLVVTFAKVGEYVVLYVS